MEMNKFSALMNLNKLRAFLYAFVALNVLSMIVAAQGASSTNISAEFCNIVAYVRDIVGVFALAMFLIGGILYAAGHFMPAAGNIRSTTQGWAMGMIIGGIVGLILVIIAPYLLGVIVSFSNGSVSASC